MSPLTRKKRDFITVALVISTVLLIHFVVFPAIDLFKVGFINWDEISPSGDFIWFDNYESTFHDVDLWQSLRNNAVYFVVYPCMIPVELVSTALFTSRLKAAEFYKTMVFMPYIINGVAISHAFSYFFSPVNSASDAILKALRMKILSSKGWLSASGVINFMLSSVSLWWFSSYHVILLMAAPQSLLQDVQEAARVDGTNAWQMSRFIQTPAIMLMVDFVPFDNIRGSLRVFDIPFVMTSGGPGYASPTFTLRTIGTAFFYNDFGLASAMAMVIMVTTLVIYLVQNKIIHGIVLEGGK